MLGVAVSTRVPAVGSLVPHVRARTGAIASQAWNNPLLGIDGLTMLEKGESAQSALTHLLKMDVEPELRQVAIVDNQGGVAAHTGIGTTPWCGHLIGDGFAICGNMLVGEETLHAMEIAFVQSHEEKFPERLMRALEAGQAAGGDKRGRQSAALHIRDIAPYPYLDLRVDEHPDPVKELRRVFEVAKVELLPFIEAMPTRELPAGAFSEELRSRVGDIK